ncbi:branched-chain amino acid transport system II carrier protein [Pontibacillus litoralis]|uniref:Branched-chain amino acid transport system carrier protein n=1 Tax=Pontibacillus litoralis JSM 072002 TaxID=1385512 RepID=A0A0A5G274_9BACI|nr:branched-chain amino acid transport system II carrier protein [Pontibacillus litoralis]KGX87196.1 branched-chain amino acid transporter [Pontibacillus litoralis JSM 072002]
MVTKKDTMFIGFMLFALFFGAGNLIYPPELGIQAGENYWLAIAGFIITGVGLPIVGVMAISLSGTDARALGDRAHPLFGLIFTSAIYLSIGPIFAIPRAANVAFEMSLKPYVPMVSSSVNMNVVLLIFSLCFFALVYWISLNPSKIVDRIGQILTPILLLAIVALAVASFLNFDSPFQPPNDTYSSGAFFEGFINGYLTMDAIAGLAFGIIVINALKERGVTDGKKMFTETFKAGAVTAIGLIFVYASIGWMGAKMATTGSYENGGEILATGAEMLFGSFGGLILGLIVTLACFTTCVGLTVACSQFFSTTFPKLQYKQLVVVITLVSFGITNLGLSQIVAISVPALVFLYPLAIVLMGLAFLDRFFKGSTYVYRGALLFTLIFSIYDAMVAIGIEVKGLESILSIAPLFGEGLGWLVPSIVGGVFGYILDAIKNGTSSTNASSKRVS